MGDSIQQQLDRLLSLFLEEQAANRAHREEVYAKIEAIGQAFATLHQADSHVRKRTDKGIAMCTAEDPVEDPHFNKWRPDVEAEKFPEDAERVQLRGEKATQIRELTSLIQRRFTNPENSVDLYVERVNYSVIAQAESIIAQAESLRYTLGGLGVRRACYGVLRFVMENGAKGCENTVSGNLRAQRAKSMKFKVWDRRKSRLHFMNGS